MLVSKIHKMQGSEDVLLGQIGAKDGKLFFQPENPVLAAMCNEPISSPDGPIEPADAEKFVENLCSHYRNAYLRASKATEAEESQNGDAE